MRNTLLVFGLLFSITLSAQSPFDCENALDVCDNAAFQVVYTDAFTDNPPVIEEDCTGPFPGYIALDSNVVWMKFVFESPGDFYFTLDPTSDFVDLDFVVFETSSGDCSELAAIRCMYSGDNIGAPGSNCLGNTGLDPGSEDFFESPGCNIGDDNFLAPLEVAAGDVIYLLVASWAVSPNFEISFGGAASIVACDINSNEEVDNSSTFEILANPVQDELVVKALPYEGIFKLSVLDFRGELVALHHNFRGENLDFGALASGMYVLQLVDAHGAVWVEKVVIE